MMAGNWCSEEAAARVQRAPARLQLAVGFDAHRAWISAQYKQLGIRKQTTNEPFETVIELGHGADTVVVTCGPRGIVVSRGTRSLVVDSPAAIESLQDLLGGSSVVFAARATLSELAAEDELRAPEINLLSSLAFVASLGGDVSAPRRLTNRNEVQERMKEADPDPDVFRAAYRRLACNALLLARSEVAWFEFIGGIQPMKAVKSGCRDRRFSS